METIANDSSYAIFRIGPEPKPNSQICGGCSVVRAPITTGPLATGSGWMFQKRSSYLPIFRHYYNMIRESGTTWRLSNLVNRPEFQSEKYSPKPTCETHKGKPIGFYKTSSIFAIVMIGLGICFLIYV